MCFHLNIYRKLWQKVFLALASHDQTLQQLTANTHFEKRDSQSLNSNFKTYILQIIGGQI